MRRGWLSEAEFAQLLAICQALPGPASSQLGFAVGLLKGGWLGGLLAFFGFTLPSALLMFGLAILAPRLDEPVADLSSALVAAMALAVMLAGGPA